MGGYEGECENAMQTCTLENLTNESFSIIPLASPHHALRWRFAIAVSVIR